MREAPEQLDALTKRVQQLEDRLRRAPGEACPGCGALEYRVTKSRAAPGDRGELGFREHLMLCGECGFDDVREIEPGKYS